jgi:hypothetical protein
MPSDSVQAAVKWRENRGLKREPTNGRSAKVQSKKKGRRRTLSKPSNTGDGLKDSLGDAVTVSKDAFVAYQDALRAESASTSSRLSEFNKALQGRLLAERMYREELQARGILVPRTEIVESCRRAMDAMLRRLKKMPGETGPQCAGREPLEIVAILQRTVNEIMQAGQKAMEGLQ